MRTGRRIAGAVEEAVREEMAGVRRELTRPWRRGRPGAAAEAGRWLGLGLALGAAMAAAVAAVWAERGR